MPSEVNHNSKPVCSCQLGDERLTDELKKTTIHHLMSFLGRDPSRANSRDLCKAISYLMRDNMIERWINTQKSYYDHHSKRVYYLSLEFLIGRSLGNSIINLGFQGPIADIVHELGHDLE